MRSAAATTAAANRFPARGRAGGVVACAVRKSKQNLARKELQKRAKQEYLRRIYETADRVEEDHLVFDLQPSSPRVRAQLAASAQHAALNQQLAAEIPQLPSWQRLQQFLQQHATSLNFLNVVALVSRAAELQQQVNSSTPDPDSATAAGTAADSSASPQQQHTLPDTSLSTAIPSATAGPADQALAAQLAVLVLQHSSWFQPRHFAASAAALSALGVTDVAVWDNLTAAAEHKVGAFTYQQLAITLEAAAAAGYTPGLSWIERTYRQAAKHLHAADPVDICVLMGAWGEMGYTPRDRLYMNQVKILTRRAFDRGQLSGDDLVQLMHGLARMPRYAPNQGWLAALAKATTNHLQHLTPGGVVDLLLSFVALDFKPPQQWMDAAMARLRGAMLTFLDDQQQGEQQLQQQQQGRQLFLPVLDLQQLQRDQQLQAPGLLVLQQEQQLLVEAPELQELQALFDEAEEAEEEEEDEEGGYQQEYQQQQEAASMRWQQKQKQQQQQQQQEEEEEDSGGADQAAGGSSSATQLACDADFAARLRSSSSCDRDSLSLRHQLLHKQLAAEHVGVLCWCLGRLQFTPGMEWMQLLGQTLLLLLLHSPAVSADVLVDVLLGCGAMGYLPVSMLQEQLLSHVLACMPTMSPEALCRTCQALVAWEAGLLQHEQHPAALALVLQQQGGAAAAGSILQHLQQHKQAIATAVVHRQGILITSSSTAQLANVLAFAAAAGQTPSIDYMAAAVTRAAAKLPDGCPTPAVCKLLWALARMGFKPHPQLLHQLLVVLQRGLHLLSSQDLADAGWALCTLRHRPGATWLSLYQKEVVAKAGYMGAQALTDTLWALACFAAKPDREWLKQVVVAVGSKASAGVLSPQNAAVAVWALQQLGFQPDLLLGPQAQSAGNSPAQAAVAPQPVLSGVQSAVVSLAQLVQQA